MPRTARDVVFVDGVRTPFGQAGPKGLYAATRADDLVVRDGHGRHRSLGKHWSLGNTGLWENISHDEKDGAK